MIRGRNFRRRNSEALWLKHYRQMCNSRLATSRTPSHKLSLILRMALGQFYTACRLLSAQYTTRAYGVLTDSIDADS